MEKKERELRSKLMKKYKSMQELQLKGQQEKLRQTVESKLEPLAFVNLHFIGSPESNFINHPYFLSRSK